MFLRFKYLFFLRKLNFFIYFVFLTTIFGLSTKYASAVSDVNDVKLQMFMESLKNEPPYCQYRLTEATFSKDVPQINGERNWPPYFGKGLNQWRQTIGWKNWRHIHHYCFGIRAFNEYSNMTPKLKKRYKEQKLQRALREFQYMKNAETLNFPFWYDLYRYETYIYLQLGDTVNAKRALEQSLKYKK